MTDLKPTKSKHSMPPIPPPLPPPFVLKPSSYTLDYFGCKFTVRQSNTCITSAMWDSGHILLKYMEQSNNKIFQEIRAMDATVTPQSYFRHQTILELGAGVGHVGLAIVLGLNPKEYIFTDYKVDEIRRNVQSIQDGKQGLDLRKSKVGILRVDWHDDPSLCYKSCSVPDIVLCIDCVWIEELYVPLLKHILYLSALNTNLVFVLGHQKREQGAFDGFFRILVNNNFVLRKVYDEELSPGASSPVVGLFIAKRQKKEHRL